MYKRQVVGLSAAGITSGLAAAGALVGGGMAAGVAVLAAPVLSLIHIWKRRKPGRDDKSGSSCTTGIHSNNRGLYTVL